MTTFEEVMSVWDHPSAVEVIDGPDGVIVVGMPSGGTPLTLVVPVPFDQWPPVDPQPNVLYLRLAP